MQSFDFCAYQESKLSTSNLSLHYVDSPWDNSIYEGAAETNAAGGVTLNGFLSEVCCCSLYQYWHACGE